MGSSGTAIFTVTPESKQSLYIRTYDVTVIRIDNVETGVYDSLPQLEVALVFMPENDPDTPYAITLSSAINFAGLYYDYLEPLTNLMKALKEGGKYITLDISAFTDTPEGSSSRWSPANDGREFLVGITLPSTITAIPNYFFANCVNLTAFDWSEYTSLVSISEGAFSHTGLTSMDLPASLKTIGNYAFEYTTGLTSLDLPASVTTIGGYAFQYTGLTSLVLPSTITSLGQYAFLRSALVTADLSALPATSVANNPHISAFSNCESLETYILPAGATSWTTTSSSGRITSALFPALKKLGIPSGMTSIPANAIDSAFRPADFTFEFQGNAKYGTIFDGKALAETLEGGGKRIMFYPAAAGTVNIPNDITDIADTAFRGSPITGVFFGAGLTQIPTDCFRDCSNLGPVTIPGHITVIGQSAFQGAGTAEGANFSVALPATLTTIGGSAFANSGLASIAIPASVSSLGGSAFQGTRLTTIDLSALTITNLGDWIFDNCKSLTSVILPPTLTSLGSAFSSTALTQITLPDTITTLGSYTFSDCTALTQITLPANLITLESYTFLRCTGLTQITLPAKVTSLGDSAFSGCTGLTQITLPATLTTLGASAFSGCTALAQITLPATLTTLGASVFTNCTALTQISLPDTLTSLGATAFRYSGLTSVTLPVSLASLPANAFTNCADLQWVKILKSDALVTLASKTAANFPITTASNTYPLIFVPDALYTLYAGDTATEPVTASQWTNAPNVPGRIRKLSEFADEFPGQ
jgi:hypothetical protein